MNHQAALTAALAAKKEKENRIKNKPKKSDMKSESTRQKMAPLQLAGHLNQNSTLERVLHHHLSKVLKKNETPEKVIKETKVG